MPRFDLLDEYACVIIPDRPHNGSKDGNANQETDLVGHSSKSDAPVPRQRSQLFYDAVMSSGACLCWISW
jgi:hypothetical protein